MSFSEAQLAELETLLKGLEKSLPDDIADAKKSSKPVELDQTAFGRVSRVDAIQQQQMQKAAVQRMELRLEQVKNALGKINTEGFGLCSICEEPISYKRLNARPESLHCISCAQK